MQSCETFPELKISARTNLTGKTVCFLLPVEKTLKKISECEKYKDKITTAREIGKGNSGYTDIKYDLPHILWNCVPGWNDADKNIKSLTGWMYFDVDPDDKNKNNHEWLQETKEEIFSHPFIKAVWTSVGGTGIGALAYCPSLLAFNTVEAYNQAYWDLTDYFLENSSIKLDRSCQNPTRKNCLSYDPEMLVREDVAPFGFVYRRDESRDKSEKDIEPRKRKSNSGPRNKKGLEFDHKFARKHSRLVEDYFYEKWVVCDRSTGLPAGNIDYISLSDDYVLKRRFSSEEISMMECKDENNLVAYVPESFASIRISMHAKTEFKRERRNKSLMAVTITYMVIRRMNAGEIFDRNQIYTILCLLNEFCVSNSSDSEIKVKDPLSDSELANIAEYIDVEFNQPNFKFKCSPAKTMIRMGFEKEYYLNNAPTNTSEAFARMKKWGKREWVNKGLNPIINKLRGKANSVDHFMYLDELFGNNQCKRMNFFIESLKQEFEMKDKKARFILEKWIREKGPNFPGPHLYGNILCGLGKKGPSGKKGNNEEDKSIGDVDSNLGLKPPMVSAVNFLLANEEKPTQKRVAELSGYALKTVKNNWDKVKEFLKSKEETSETQLVEPTEAEIQEEIQKNTQEKTQMETQENNQQTTNKNKLSSEILLEFFPPDGFTGQSRTHTFAINEREMIRMHDIPVARVVVEMTNG